MAIDAADNIFVAIIGSRARWFSRATEKAQFAGPMNNLRTYGKAPFNVAVIHGGPGAGGEMAPVAVELASRRGVLEPIQTATSLNGQVDELKDVLERQGDGPFTLIGYSWGAWLAILVTAHHARLTRKLILVGSGPFEEKYAGRLQEIRKSRLSKEEGVVLQSVIRAFGSSADEDRGLLLERLGALTSKTDSYDPVSATPDETVSVAGRSDIFRNVWNAASELRKSGRLLELAKLIRCPVVAIHGDYDPHPAEGVQEPLSALMKEFRFVLLRNCGHTPWVERQAREEFYRILEEELR